MKQVLEAIDHLHDNNIVHLDIKVNTGKNNQGEFLLKKAQAAFLLIVDFLNHFYYTFTNETGNRRDLVDFHIKQINFEKQVYKFSARLNVLQS